MTNQQNIAIKAVRKGGFNKTAYDEYTAFRDNFSLNPYIERRFKEENILKN